MGRASDPDRERLFATGPIETDIGGNGAKRKPASIIDQKAEFSRQGVHVPISGEHRLKRLGGF